MRTVVLHYHLFKNAGTSLDQILKKNFGDKWITREFSSSNNDNSAEVAEWIADNPEAVAFSTHTAVGPAPVVKGVNVVTVMLLRDPLARLRSAYRFERTQEADTWGANLAKEFPFDGYIRARLTHPTDRQCRNFQTWRLSTMVLKGKTEFDRAKKAAEAMSVIGLVERFDRALEKLTEALADDYPDFAWEVVKANTSKSSAETAHYMAETRRLTARLRDANADDLALLDWLRDIG